MIPGTVSGKVVNAGMTSHAINNHIMICFIDFSLVNGPFNACGDEHGF